MHGDSARSPLGAAVEELVAAYQTLDLDTHSSPLVIQTRYRELAQTYHGDKWSAGSTEQAAAAERMRKINAAYDLIEDAPLQYRHVQSETPVEEIPQTPHQPPSRLWDWFLRIEPILFVRFFYGFSAGTSLVYWLYGPSAMWNTIHVWLVPVALGAVFARTTWLTNRLLEAIIDWGRRV